MIDAHRHFWRYSPAAHGWIDDSMPALRRDFLPGEPVLFGDDDEGNGCVAVQALHSLEETRWLLEASERITNLRGVVGWIDLCAVDVPERLDELASCGKLVGLRHLVQDEPMPHFLGRQDFRRGLSLLAERDLCFDLLLREAQRDDAIELVRDLPAQRFVVDHLAKPRVGAREFEPWRRQMREFGRCENVFAKLSGLATEADWKKWTPADLAPYIDVALESFGPARLIFGSDWPVCLLAGDAQRVAAAHVDPLRRLSPTEFRAITHGNAVLAYGLRS